MISDKDKKLTAYHEAGHAIVSQFLSTQTEVKEVSIIPRGLAGGYTMYKSDEDKYYISKTEMEEKLIALLGGRAAEKIALNDISTGASNDIEVATKIAKDMVTVYGMSDNIGPLSLKDTENQIGYQLFGDSMEDNIGKEVKLLIDKAYLSAQQILTQNMDKLHEIAQVLLEKEKINEREFKKFFEE
ncbi:ATP-dependent zinc metalloprotease FtsH [compost metagenome]